MTGEAIEQSDNGVRIRVRAQPRASRTAFAGAHGDALKLRIAAPPVDGAANDELVRFLAKSLRVPKSAIRIVMGQTGRTKVVEIDGVTVAELRRTFDF